MSAVGILGSRPVSGLASLMTRHRLRILAYHGIPDEAAFTRQLDHVAKHFHSVSGVEVAAALDGGPELEDRSVWITFDDGAPEVVHSGMSLLLERGLVATAFVCAGMIGTRSPYWWETVDAAASLGLVSAIHSDTAGGHAVVARLKLTADDGRRAVVSDLDSQLKAQGHGLVGEHLDTDDLRRWVDAGLEIGNHSWDHPCLDQCSPAQQEWQVTQAHECLTEMLGCAPVLFAWPNGNAAGPARSALRNLGYRLLATFDHRICSASPDPWALSRLRVDTDADLARFRSIISGAHPAVFHATRRLRSQGGPTGG